MNLPILSETLGSVLFFWIGYLGVTGWTDPNLSQATFTALALLLLLLLLLPTVQSLDLRGFIRRPAVLFVCVLAARSLVQWTLSAAPATGALTAGTLAGWGGLELAARLSRRWLRRVPESDPGTRRVLIAGAGEAGVMVARQLLEQPELDRRVVAFVDDDPATRTAELPGSARVVGTTQEVADSCERWNVDEVIIAMPSAGGEVIRRVTRQANRMNADLRIVPGIREIIEGDVHWNQIRTVRPEDLLGRETVQVDRDDLEEHLTDKRVLVTGAAGSLGSELVREILEYPVERLLGLDLNESALYELEVSEPKLTRGRRFETTLGDVRNAGRMSRIVGEFRPDILIHAAALKHVPMMERFPRQALRTNVGGSLNVFEAADEHDVEQTLLVSTDKAVDPSNVMGLSKRIGEQLVGSFQGRSSTSGYMAVRFGNVLGTRGSVVPLFKNQIERGGPVTVTDPDAVRYFMTPGEAVKLVLTSLTLQGEGPVFVLNMGEPIGIMDLARQLISLAGYRPGADIPIVVTGLRAGESVEEKLFHDRETVQSTAHEKISRVRAPQLDGPQLDRLAELVNHPPADGAAIRSRLRGFVEWSR